MHFRFTQSSNSLKWILLHTVDSNGTTTLYCTCPSCWWARCRCCEGWQDRPTQCAAGCGLQHTKWWVETRRWDIQWAGRMKSWSYFSRPVWRFECCLVLDFDSAGRPAPAAALPRAHAHTLCSPVEAAQTEEHYNILYKIRVYTCTDRHTFFSARKTDV